MWNARPFCAESVPPCNLWIKKRKCKPMWILAGIAGMMIWVGSLEASQLWKQRQVRSLILLVFIAATVSVLGFLQGWYSKIVNPLDGIEALFGPWARMLYNLFS